MAKQGTVRDSELHCPHCRTTTPISTIRGDRRGINGREYGLRLWENDDLVPRPEDVFQERLYCIRWVEAYQDIEGREYTQRYYRAPDERDLEREQRVLELLRERFADWQDKGYIPSRRIEPGDKTDEPVRTRGWTHWHHLFNPRQLLIIGLFSKETATIIDINKKDLVGLILSLGRIPDWCSKLCRWTSTGGFEKSVQTFSDQALNTLLNYCTRPVISLKSAWYLEFSSKESYARSASNILVNDARLIKNASDLWLTDPPYADAINYQELTEFFLAWYEKHILRHFPDWYTDSKRALAVRGNGEPFRKSMVDIYRNLARHMPDNGMQIVMFTHQDAGVWADLALILWAAGLRVTAAWTIATETNSALKKGNYVQGTVLLVLRKQLSNDMAFTDEINADIKPEVERQLKSMMELDDKEDPNFSDSDYNLAAYAAALRVITQYKNIEGLDAERELSRVRAKGEKSVFEQMIVNAVKIASNYLIPKLHDNENNRRDIWRNLSAEERFYLKALEVESHGDYRQGVYQEFARGYGLHDYKFLLQSGKANETRLKTATEFRRRDFDTPGFGSSLLRHILFAIAQARETEVVEHGMGWLRTAIQGDYWRQRETIAALLRYLARLPMEHWQADVAMARILAGAVENDGV